MFRFLTLNLNFDNETHGPWPERRERIVRHLIPLRPDAIALQAVRRFPDGRDQARELAERLGRYDVFFQPAATFSDGRAEGSALLAASPLGDRHFLQFSVGPQTEDRFQRVILHATVSTASGPLHLFSSHFSWVANQAETNFREALPYLNRYGSRRLCAGDFNQAPESPLLQRWREAGWVDVWTAKRGAEEGPTFESGKLFTRIDYIWADPAAAALLRDVRRVPEPVPAPGETFSDHLALLAEFDL